MKVIIIGGVAGGASAAARIRRLDETAQIIVLERSLLCKLRVAVFYRRRDQGAGRADSADAAELLGAFSY